MFLEPLTRRALRAAGARPGATVLDLGTGAGDVALLAAEMTGPGGRVVAVDRDPLTLDRARARAAAAGASAVEFTECDVREIARLGTFDIVIGRLILLHLPVPAAAVRGALACVAEGGTLVFQEPVLSRAPKSHPPAPAWEEAWRLALDALEASGVHLDIGLRLAELFARAGLPAPGLACETMMWGADPAAAEWMAATLASLAPVLHAHGIAGPDDLDAGGRMTSILDEVQRLNSQLLGMTTVAGWATRPPAPAE
jgi:SAM-dependent methyltransferase